MDAHRPGDALDVTKFEWHCKEQRNDAPRLDRVWFDFGNSQSWRLFLFAARAAAEDDLVTRFSFLFLFHLDAELN